MKMSMNGATKVGLVSIVAGITMLIMTVAGLVLIVAGITILIIGLLSGD